MTETATTTSFSDRKRSPETSTDNGHAAAPPRRRAGRTATVIVLIVSLVAAGVMRSVATRFQEAHSPLARRTSGTGGGSSLAGMDTYALALLLGGLRGPLVMVLWANSESQKADRDLEGIDTQIEWIRRLQPEFDSVHVFQMWNKAYNLSVQMVGLSNKYTTILDAIDYGQSVDAERPDNLNILKELARIYGDKLGNSNPEKYYYRDRLRRETKYREQVSAKRDEPGFRRNVHDPLLDAEGRVLPQYLKPRPSFEHVKGGESYNGAELQYLKHLEPFPYGLSPFAISYNYNKRAQMLLTTDQQKPIGLSTAVIDSQPAVSLKMWAESEWEDSRKLECKAFGIPLPTERIAQEQPTAAVPVNASVVDASAFAELVETYRTAIRVGQESLAEYDRHLRNPDYITNRAKYASHIDAIQAMLSLLNGDLNYVLAMQSSGEQRGKLLASAALFYRKSIRETGLVTLRYYTGDALTAKVMPPGVTRANLGTGAPGSITAVTDEDVMRMMNGVNDQIARNGGPMTDDNADDRAEYMAYINRALQRIDQIGKASAG